MSITINLSLCLCVYLLGSAFLISNYELGEEDKPSDWIFVLFLFLSISLIGMLFELDRLVDVLLFQTYDPLVQYPLVVVATILTFLVKEGVRNALIRK